MLRFTLNGVPLGADEISVLAPANVRPGPVVAEGDGFRASLRVADDATEGAVPLSVVDTDGTSLAMVRLNVVAAPVQGRAATQLRREEKSAAAGTASKPAKGAEDGRLDSPWLDVRVSGGLGTYGYQQAPNDDDALLTSELVWGLGRGGVAVPAAGTLDVSAHLPKLPFLGAHLNGRVAPYSVSSGLFVETVRDVLWTGRAEVSARLPIRTARSTGEIGVRAGLRVDDFLVFEGCTEPGCTLNFRTLVVPAMGLSLHGQGRIQRLRLEGEAGTALAYGTVPYLAYGEARVGVYITQAFYADLGFHAAVRRSQLRGASSESLRGNLVDQLLLGDVGLGLSF